MSSNAFIQSATLDRVVDFARDLGLDPSDFFRANAISSLSPNPHGRISAALFADFLVHAAEVLKEPHFGLKAGAAFHPSDLGALGYLLMNAPSATIGLADAERLFAFQQDGGFFQTRREYPGEITLRYDGGELNETSGRQDAECGIALIHALIRQLIGRSVTPLLIRLRHQGEKTDRTLREHFGCAIQFGSADNAIVYDAGRFDAPMRNVDPRLYQILSDFIVREIADLPGRDDLVAEIRWRIRRLTPLGRAKLSIIARDMGQSRRTLQRKLHNEHTTFAELLNEIRLEKWRDEATCSTGAELSDRLGFSDASAFYKWRRKQRPESQADIRQVAAKVRKPEP